MKLKKKLKFNREVHMEDLDHLHNRVYEELGKRNIWFDSVTADNKFSEELSEFLEKSFDFPSYQNYN